MENCERLEACPFFRDELHYLPQTARFLKEAYCNGDKWKCARYLVVSEGIKPPADLFPNQSDRVSQILNQAEQNPSQE